MSKKHHLERQVIWHTLDEIKIQGSAINLKDGQYSALDLTTFFKTKIKEIEEIQEQVKIKGYDNVLVRIYTDYIFETSTIEYTWYVTRLETDAEYNDRIQQHNDQIQQRNNMKKNQRQKRKEEEYREYLRLQKKFEKNVKKSKAN